MGMSETGRETRRVAIVTGASSGIGLATAERLAASGWCLVLAARTPDPLGAAAQRVQRCGGEAIGVPTHVDDPHQSGLLVDRAVDHFGRLDAVVNSAGFATLASIEETTPEAMQKSLAINALGPAYLIARAWPVFVRQRTGCVVNISTMATRDPFPGFFAYAASKAPMNLMVRSCANEGAEHGIRAFAIAPGAVETPMLRSLFDERAISRDATLSPDEVAARVVACILGEHDDQSGEIIWMPNP